MLTSFHSISEGSRKRNTGFDRKYFTWDGRGRGENPFDLKVVTPMRRGVSGFAGRGSGENDESYFYNCYYICSVFLGDMASSIVAI